MAFASPMVYHLYWDIWILDPFGSFCFNVGVGRGALCAATLVIFGVRSRRGAWKSLHCSRGHVKWFKQPVKPTLRSRFAALTTQVWVACHHLGCRPQRFHCGFFSFPFTRPAESCGWNMLEPFDSRFIFRLTCISVPHQESMAIHGYSSQFHVDHSYHDRTRSGKHINF